MSTEPPRTRARYGAWLLAAVAAGALAGCGVEGGPGSPTAEPPATEPPGGQATTSVTATVAPTATAAAGPARPERKAAPDLRVTSFDGETITLGAFRGRPVVVNFFESW